jgi:hypothetical protein
MRTVFASRLRRSGIGTFREGELKLEVVQEDKIAK